MRLPATTELAELQQCFRELWEAIDGIRLRNIDMHGNRIINAGQSVSPSDYVTYSELQKVKVDLMDVINNL